MNASQAMNIVIGSDLDPKFKRAFQSAGKQFEELGADISKLKKQQKSIANFEMKTASLESARYKLNAAQQDVRKLSREMKSTQSTADKMLTSKLSKNLSDATLKVDKLALSLAEGELSLESIAGELKATGQSVADFEKKLQSANEAGDDKLAAKMSKGLDTARLKLDKLTKSLENKEATLKSLRPRLDEARKAVSKLAEELKDAEANGDSKLAARLSKGLEEAKRKVNGLSTALEKQKGDLRTARVEMDKSGVNAREYAKDNDKVTRSLKRLQDRQQQMARLSKTRAEIRPQLRNRAVGVAAGGYGLSRMMSGAIEGKSMAADIAITANLDDSQIAEMEVRIAQLSGNNKTFQGKAALRGGLSEMVTQGMEFDDAMSRLEAVGLTAKAANADVNDMSKTAFSLSNNMDITGAQSQKAFDMLVLGGKKGSFELKEMAKYFPAITADAKKLGITGLEGVATLTSALQISMRTSGDPAEAANNFKNFLAKVTAPETIKKFAKEYKIDIEAEMKAATKQGIDPMQFLVERTMDVTGGDEFRVGELFGDMQAKSFLTAMSKNKADFDKMKADIMGADGTSRADADRRFELDPQMKIDKMMEAFTTLRNNVLVPMVEPVTQLATAFATMAKPMGEFIQANPEIVKGIVAVGAAGFALNTAVLIGKYMGLGRGFRLGARLFNGGWGLMTKNAPALDRSLNKSKSKIGGFNDWVSGAAKKSQTNAKGMGSGVVRGFGRIGGAARGATRVAAMAMRGASMMLMANPIGLGVTALVTGAGLVYDNWDTVHGFFKNKFPAATQYATEKAQQLVSWWETSTLTEKAFGIATAPMRLAKVVATDVWSWWESTSWGKKSIEVGTDLLASAKTKGLEIWSWWSTTSWGKKSLPLTSAAATNAKQVAGEVFTWWASATPVEKAFSIITAPMQVGKAVAVGVFNWWKTTPVKARSFNVMSSSLEAAERTAQRIFKWWQGLSLKSLSFKATSERAVIVGGQPTKVKATGGYEAGNMSQADIMKQHGIKPTPSMLKESAPTASAEIVSGINSGIESGGESVTKSGEGLGSKILGGFKSVLSINSPSRVFRHAGFESVAGALVSGVNAKQSVVSKTGSALGGSLFDGFKKTADPRNMTAATGSLLKRSLKPLLLGGSLALGTAGAGLATAQQLPGVQSFDTKNNSSLISRNKESSVTEKQLNSLVTSKKETAVHQSPFERMAMTAPANLVNTQIANGPINNSSKRDYLSRMNQTSFQQSDQFNSSPTTALYKAAMQQKPASVSEPATPLIQPTALQPAKPQVSRVDHRPTYNVTVDVAKIDANTSVEAVTALVREALATVEAERSHSFDNALFDKEAYQ